MSTVVESLQSTTAFSRSHSTPDLSALNYPTPRPSSRGAGSSGTLDVNFNFDFELDTSSFNAHPTTASPTGRSAGRRVTVQHDKQLPPTPTIPATESRRQSNRPTFNRSRTGSLIDRPRSWFPTMSAVVKGDVPGSPATARQPLGDEHNARPSDRTKAADGLANFRRSILGSSSSTSTSTSSSSTSTTAPQSKRRPKSATPARSSAWKREASPPPPMPKGAVEVVEEPESLPKNKSSDSLKATPKAFSSMASSYITKMRAKQPKAFTKLKETPDSDMSSSSSASSLGPPSNSTEARTSQSTSGDSRTTAPDESPAETDAPSAKPRDMLWSYFQIAWLQHQALLSKPMHQRIGQVHSELLPFLRRFAEHPSTKELDAEAVERRAQILNKLWGSVLELLDGQGGKAVPGVDRPVLYESLLLIMTRPEWRMTTESYLTLDERQEYEAMHRRPASGNESDSSQDAAFLVESVEHNVRTMFITNLINQMSFAVSKLSLHHLPLSLVTFAAKTCAYSFFFAPGVADILVRLWGLSPETIKRAGDELGLPTRDKGEGDRMSATFPHTLAPFAWSSPKGMWNMLKQIPKLPVTIGRINWTGPWVSRWKGMDTDLLFAFFKQFFILSEGFTPRGLGLSEKAKTPAFGLVQAQLLSVIDTTIHRQTSLMGALTPPPPTFEAIQQGQGMQSIAPGADAAAGLLPLPSSNLVMSMAENRVIVLLKAFLSDDAPEVQKAKETFAVTCSAMIKAAVRRTSQFNNHACFTLCDFLEEALVVFDRSNTSIDWPFWLDVFKQIFSSLNTMSEVRVLSFIYVAWDTITRDPKTKAAVCLDWLLSEAIFDAFFNHWCPMVRAYYHRLLCWRICRDVGKTVDETDTQILQTVVNRLGTVWSHYMWTKLAAERENRFPASTAPMYPTPGKKFMIIRQEVNMPQPGLFQNFDSLIKAPSSNGSADEDAGDSSPSKAEGRKKWSLLTRVLGINIGGGESDQRGHSRTSSWDDEFLKARRETAESRIRANPRISSPPSPDRQSTCSSPLYEEQQYVFRFLLTWQQQPIVPSRDRLLTPPRLPGPAQLRVEGKDVTATSSRGSGGPESVVASDSPPRLGLMTRGGAAVEVREMGEGESSDEGDDGAWPLVCKARPVQPAGRYLKTAVYTGRALAEWMQVVLECNTFVERRQDEGAGDLSQVEVPLLGVDSFRKMGG